MKTKPLGCLTPIGLGSTAVVVVLVGLLLVLTGGTIFSPGALNSRPGAIAGGVSSHAELGGNCAACHPAPWSAETLTDRCTACHPNVLAEIARPDTLHGILASGKTTLACKDCHTEHHGAAGSLTKTVLTDFPHERLGFSLAAHTTRLPRGQALLCADCHLTYTSASASASGGTQAFKVTICSDCHGTLDTPFMQNHTDSYGTACLGCHDGVETYGKAFNHQAVAFKLEGKHALAVVTGQPPAGATTPAVGAGQTPPDRNTPTACGQCHAGEKTLAEMKATPTTCIACHQKDDTHQGAFGTDCAKCHTAEGWDKATFDHSIAAFPLTGAHTTLACEKCHINKVFKGTPTTCFACHQKDDHHQGSLGQDCAACHVTSDWKQVSFDHGKSAFPLTGAHTTVTCEKCHVNGVFKGTPTICYACHQKDDHHQGAFGTDCGACHVTTAWNQVSIDHNQFAFKLVGAHIQVACEKCHVNGVFKDTPITCYACHQKDDRHQGSFGQDCSLCHTPVAWNQVTFDHSKSAFPLTGAHLKVTCAQCHANGVFKGTPTQCVNCHAEPAYHRGVLGTDCKTCHTTSAWQPASFNGAHAFPLRHGGANSCRQCHPSTLGAYDCFSCHQKANMVSRHAGEGINDISNCVRCHPTGGGGG